jgi:hypothetical protein
MSYIQIIIAFWLAGWLISVGAYVWSAMTRARKAGTSWSLTQNLVSVSALLLTWLPSLILYLYVRVKVRSGGP